MSLYDHQTAELLGEYGVAVPAFGVATSAEGARDLCAEIGGRAWIVRAGLRPSERLDAESRIPCASTAAVAEAAGGLLGQPVERSDGTTARRLDRVLVEVLHDASAVFYVGLAIDRAFDRIVLIGSSQGGSALEDIRKHAPDSIVHLPIDPAIGLQPFQARRLLLELGLEPDRVSAGAALLESVFRAFVDLEATAVEINRLTLEGENLLARDVTLLFDRGALFRHPRVREYLEREHSSVESLAAEYDLGVVPMSGSVGVVVSGHGLAAVTADLLRQAGMEPRVLVDIGTSATPEATAAAFRLVSTMPDVDRILVNVFAGLNRCDWVAEGILAAMADGQPTIPVVARLAGTKVQDGRKWLETGRNNVHCTTDLDEGIALLSTATKQASP